MKIDKIVDFDNYPINDLRDFKIKRSISKCRKQLATSSCCVLPKFILPEAIFAMRDQLNMQLKNVYWSEERVNPYFSEDEPRLPKRHPKRTFGQRKNGYLNSDFFHETSQLKFLYEQEELLEFISVCLGVSPIYRWADPLARHACNIMKPGHELPWHFDSCEFTLSLLIQKSEKGGIFEYCPNVRQPEKENFEEVQKVLEGDRSRVHQLELEPGDLQVFRGRFSLHRVTKVEGSQARYLAIPTFVLDPERVNTPEHSRVVYGRALPVHFKRHKIRVDRLAD